VVNSDDLAADAPLLESGMDSLSGVEFRNRLLKGFGGVRIPNSAVFDYPTVASLAAFIDAQLGGEGGTAATPSSEPRGTGAGAGEEAPAPRLLVQLGERAGGAPLFFVPGAGMQAGGFQALAALLPVPSYSVSWPKDAMSRSSWPATLEALAERLLQDIREVWPSGPYFFAGHSFGATLCLEMARLVERQGECVGLVALLDPRSLLPIEADIGGAFRASGLADSLALLAQSMADGSKYAQHVEELAKVEAAEHPALLQRLLSPAALATLEHVHETSQWYAGLLGAASGEPQRGEGIFARTVWLCGAETWREEPRPGEGRAEALTRQFEGRVFQGDAEVARRVAACRGGAEALPPIRVPGGHFAMLHEPHVGKVALRLCHALVEAGAAEA